MKAQGLDHLAKSFNTRTGEGSYCHVTAWDNIQEYRENMVSRGIPKFVWMYARNETRMQEHRPWLKDSSLTYVRRFLHPEQYDEVAREQGWKTSDECERDPRNFPSEYFATLAAPARSTAVVKAKIYWEVNNGNHCGDKSNVFQPLLDVDIKSNQLQAELYAQPDEPLVARLNAAAMQRDQQPAGSSSASAAASSSGNADTAEAWARYNSAKNSGHSLVGNSGSRHRSSSATYPRPRSNTPRRESYRDDRFNASRYQRDRWQPIIELYQGRRCNYCGEKGHPERVCMKKGELPRKVCNYCGHRGHLEHECHKKWRDEQYRRRSYSNDSSQRSYRDRQRSHGRYDFSNDDIRMRSSSQDGPRSSSRGAGGCGGDVPDVPHTPRQQQQQSSQQQQPPQGSGRVPSGMPSDQPPQQRSTSPQPPRSASRTVVAARSRSRGPLTPTTKASRSATPPTSKAGAVENQSQNKNMALVAAVATTLTQRDVVPSRQAAIKMIQHEGAYNLANKYDVPIPPPSNPADIVITKANAARQRASSRDLPSVPIMPPPPPKSGDSSEDRRPGRERTPPPAPGLANKATSAPPAAAAPAAAAASSRSSSRPGTMPKAVLEPSSAPKAASRAAEAAQMPPPALRPSSTQRHKDDKRAGSRGGERTPKQRRR